MRLETPTLSNELTLKSQNCFVLGFEAGHKQIEVTY
jgi:hypothetical protein